MNKLLLSSVSVMAFVTAATSAAELPNTLDTAELKNAAKAELDLTVRLPETNLRELVKAQTLSTLNEAHQRLLGKGLYAMTDKRSAPETTQGE